MSKIEYVCLSDLHFGDTASVLTTLTDNGADIDPTRPGDTLTQLVACLRSLVARCGGGRPRLVLAGDALEFALASDNIALMAFEQFLRLLAGGGDPLFSEILFIPGNHDHHIWETARETQYARYVTTVPPGKRLAPPWHTTTLITDEKHPGVPSELLGSLLRSRAGDTTTSISVVYPNHGFFSADGTRAVIFSHGHYIETIYQLMSKLKTWVFPAARAPERIYEIEEENFAWIDFFWSMMGRQGDAGKDVDHIYKALHDPKRLEEVIGNLSASMAKEFDLPFVPEALEPKIIAMLLRKIVAVAAKGERDESGDPVTGLSKEGEAGLRWFVERPLRDQILHEGGQLMPLRMAFIWGHTHKPFARRMDFNGYPHEVEVFNTGGWVIESPEHAPNRGGAVILVDDAQEVVSIEMFHDVDAAAPVKVTSAGSTRDAQVAFRDAVEQAIAADPAQWSAFSNAVAAAVEVRHARLAKMR